MEILCIFWKVGSQLTFHFKIRATREINGYDFSPVLFFSMLRAEIYGTISYENQHSCANFGNPYQNHMTRPHDPRLKDMGKGGLF